MTLLQVTIPDGLYSGDTMQVSFGDEMFDLSVPDDVQGGDTIEVSLPTKDDDDPMVPLTPHTTHLVDYSAFTMMKKSAVFINMARSCRQLCTKLTPHVSTYFKRLPTSKQICSISLHRMYQVLCLETLLYMMGLAMGANICSVGSGIF